MAALPFTRCPRSMRHHNGTERVAIVDAGLAGLASGGVCITAVVLCIQTMACQVSGMRCVDKRGLAVSSLRFSAGKVVYR